MMVSNEAEQPDSLWNRIKRNSLNGWSISKTKSANVKEVAMIKKLNFDIQQRKKIFGVDYLTLKGLPETTPEELQACMDDAEADIKLLQDQVKEHEKTIANNQESLMLKMQQNGGGPAPEGAPEPIVEPPPVPQSVAKPEVVSASEL